MLSLQAINRFAVKSCRGESLRETVVEPWGLQGDRRWMLVDDDGAQLTARQFPQLVLVHPRLRADGGLEIDGPDLPHLSVDPPGSDVLVDVQVWKTGLQAAPAVAAAHAWFGKVIGRSVRLVYLDDPTRRRPNPRFAAADDRVSFADGYPLHVTTTASLDALNDLIAEGPRSDEGPLPMIRFRPNLVVHGGDAWAEDGWRRIRVGDAVFRAVKGCDRCVLTTVDPATAAKGKEPIATLARHRRWDGATWFGMDLIPDTPGVQVAVGDEVEVLDAVPAPDGPPR